jgi:hypothetical protein
MSESGREHDKNPLERDKDNAPRDYEKKRSREREGEV